MSDLFLLDTDIASYIIKGRRPAMDVRLNRLDPMQICLSVITRAELRFGVRRRPLATRLAGEVENFLQGIHILSWDEDAADCFADVRVALERAGKSIGITDTMIAAHAISLKATLVTNNAKHFGRVNGLVLENWSI